MLTWSKNYHFYLPHAFKIFKITKSALKFFAFPVDLTVENILDCFQLEIIELQENVDFKRVSDENDFLIFYKRHVYCGNYKNLENHAKNNLSFREHVVLQAVLF